MDVKSKRFDRIKIDTNNTNLLRIGVIFLSIVSFYTTANGMNDYIFIDNATVAYAASAAIQGILLALSMNLPGYLMGIWNRSKEKHEKEKWYIIIGRWLLKVILCICAILLTVVTLFCSSWFSYVYIADVIHQDSWGIDSELLVQQTYRTQLYNARDYARMYRIYLEESLGEKILLLEEQAGNLSDSEVDITVDWEEEKANYISEQATTASSYMATVIDAMEKVFSENDSQENRDIAATAVEDAKTNIANRMEDIQNNLNTLDANITNYNNQIANLTNRINRATAETDTTALTNSINSYTQLISETAQQQQALQIEYMQLDRALLRLPFYESRLGLSSSTSAISIRSGLMQLQSEFFRQEPDEESMLEIATEIFDNLRSASRIASGNGNEASMEETQSYTNLLVQMNRLIQNLTDYSEIKDIELNLEQLIIDLRKIDITDESTSETADTSKKEQWKLEWGRRLTELKAQINSLPVYGEIEETGNDMVKVLSENQMVVLRNYDRNSASKELDDMTRRYISNHNEIYQGIIYLQSPYRSLAIFALILALSFDLSGFIFGFVVQGSTPRYENSDDLVMKQGDQSKLGVSYVDTNENVHANWSVLKTLNPYIVLTGDYENEDGNYYYKTFKDGKLYKWPVQDISPYMRGIYIQVKRSNGWWRGSAIPIQGQELFYAHQKSGPKDGIYMDCRFSFVEGSLILERGGQREFLTTIDEYAPVHSYNPSRGESRTIPAKKLTSDRFDVETAVVALNEKGTRVAAIYMIEKS